MVADAGYQGVASLHSNSQTPAKKRVLVEDIIRKLKIFRILSERYRNRRKRFELRFNLIATIIYNLELRP